MGETVFSGTSPRATWKIISCRRRDAEIEEYLDAKGVKWTFRPKVSPDEFDIDKSLRNQARFEPITEDRVNTYAEAMRRGDKFPPVIAHGTRLLTVAGAKQ